MKKKTQTTTNLPIIISLIAVLIVAALIVIVLVLDSGVQPSQTDGTTEAFAGSESTESVDEIEEVSFTADLGQGISITGAGRYSGIYMEDGSDAVTDNVLMITVRNDSASTLQYAEITVATSTGTAKFSVSTLAPSATAVLLEKEKMRCEEDTVPQSAAMANAVFFAEEPTLCEDRLEITAGDGAITVKNISATDIAGDIAVYYKNFSDGIYYGGITYRSTLSGGLGVGEERTLTAIHYKTEGSRVMFATCAP